MTTEMARATLGVGAGASREETRVAYEQLKEQLLASSQRAPTSSLQEKYRQRIADLEEAFRQVQTGPSASAADPRENLPRVRRLTEDTPTAPPRAVVPPPWTAPAISSQPMKFWVKATIALAAVWIVAGSVIWWLHAHKPTPQSVATLLDGAKLDALSARGRARTIRRAEDQLNELTFQQRQELQQSGSLRRFFLAMTKEEQGAFLDATLPSDFRQLMDVFNKMDPAKRKAFVARAVEEMKKHAGEGPVRGMDEQMSAKIVDQGLKSFYSDASADTKIDMAPLIEQMQRNLQFGNTN